MLPEFSHGFRGAIADAPDLETLRLLPDGLLLVDQNGKVTELMDAGSSDAAAILSARANDIQTLSKSEILIPGFVDLHVHAPQWPQMGKALHLPLEDWLQQYTFPLEARYQDIEFAKHSYGNLVDTLLANGTTTALYFGTIHNEASLLLAEICLQKGQRALVGRLAMDNHAECPEFYRDPSASAALDGTERFIEDVRALPGNENANVQPVVTPRFIPSCTDECLEGLGQLAEKHNTHIQSHVSESDWQHGYVLERHGKSDTESLADFGLVTRHTVLAHGTMLSASDLDHLAGAGAAVAHCPLSNIYFSNAVFPLRAALLKGVHVGLGTDISGGPSPSLLENARHAVHSSRMLEEGVDASKEQAKRGVADTRIDFAEAFFLATRGGAVALDLPTGSFETGHHFDALVIDVAAPGSNIFHAGASEPHTADELAEWVQKIVFNASRANIAQVWAGGALVSGKTALDTIADSKQ